VSIQQLVLLEGVAEEAQLPEHHSEAAVGELLDVHAEDLRVQLGAPEEVNNDVAVGAIVLGGGEVQALDGQESTQANGEQIHRRQ
jgi:hypothetical protein